MSEYRHFNNKLLFFNELVFTLNEIVGLFTPCVRDLYSNSSLSGIDNPVGKYHLRFRVW